MKKTLLETYAPQLKVADAYIAKNYGHDVSANTKLTTAVLLDNTNRFLNESLSDVTSTYDLGRWSKFCLNLTNIAVPSLIANDLVIVHPMTRSSGSVAYLKYVALSDKNGMQYKDLNSVFGLGEMTDGRVNYTSQIIVEEGTTPSLDVIEKGLSHDVEGAVVFNTYKCIKDDGTFEYVDDIASATGTVKKIAYVAKQWQMAKVPAEDIPTIGPKMDRIALVAEPRRIAVRYDQITAFQA